MAKGGKTQTVTTAPDAETQARAAQVWGAAQQAAGQPPDANTTAAGDYYHGAMGAGNLGFGALSGDPNALGKLMNPYQSQVIDATNADFDHSGAMAHRGANDAATAAGAFGGARHGVAEGVAQSANERNRNAALAGIRTAGYGDAMARAGQMANLGMGASGNLAGMAGMLDPNMRRMMILQQGMSGLPQGSVTTQPVNRNRGAGALGGAATGAELGSSFGPWGTGIGAVAGGLMGLFG